MCTRAGPRARRSDTLGAAWLTSLRASVTHTQAVSFQGLARSGLTDLGHFRHSLNAFWLTPPTPFWPDAVARSGEIDPSKKRDVPKVHRSRPPKQSDPGRIFGATMDMQLSLSPTADSSSGLPRAVKHNGTVVLLGDREVGNSMTRSAMPPAGRIGHGSKHRRRWSLANADES